MRKFVYFCILLFIGINSMAQAGLKDTIDNDLHALEKYLYFQYNPTQLPVDAGWIKDDVYSDEFDESVLNGSKWKKYDLYIHEHNLNVGCLKENVNVSNGKLILSAYYSSTGTMMPHQGDSLNIHYLTGAIISRRLIRYGYYEIECYLPKNHHLRPCFWAWGEIGQGQHDEFNDYNEIDVNENPDESPCDIQQNIYTNYKHPNPSGTRQHLTVSDSIMGKTSRFGVEVLPYEIVWYINGRVSSHLRYTIDTASANGFSMFTYSDITKTRPMYIRLSFNMSVVTSVPGLPTPYEDFTVEYFRCYKMERGRQNTYHPSVFTPSAESCKVYPNVILGGSGYTAVVNTSTAVWAEQSIILDEGFTLTAGNTFSARIIQHGTENPATSPLYIGNYSY